MKKMKKTRIPVKYEIIRPPLKDNRFTPVKILLMHTGLNLNNSYFEKSVIEKAIPTLANIPILGFIQADKRNRNDFKGHEEQLVIKDDELKVEYLGSAYGVIPESNNARFQIIDNKEYLVVNGLIYNMFEEAKEILDRDEFKNQSMELFEENLEGEWKENVFHFTDFTFRGACLLGDDVIPAMEGSKVIKEQVYSYSFSYSSDMLKAIRDFNTKFADIKIDNSKENSINGEWENPEKDLYEPLMEQENSLTLLKEAYLIVGENWESSPSTDLKYPHHVLIEDKLVVHEQGVKSAFARLAQTEPENKEAIEHLKKHYQELELDMTEINKYERSTDMNFEKMYNETLEQLNAKIAEFEAVASELENIKAEKEAIVAEKEVLFSEKEELISFKNEILAEQRKQAEAELFSKFEGKIDEEIISSIKETASEFELSDLEVKLFAELGKASLVAKEEIKEEPKQEFEVKFEKKESTLTSLVDEILSGK